MSPEIDLPAPTPVAVIGGGQMGAGIAQVLLIAGAAVTLVEPRAPDRARSRVRTGLEGAAERGKLDESLPAVLERLEVRTSVAELPEDAALVVEAVPEDAALKAEVLRTAEAAVGPRALLATNTSSLSVGELAAVLDRPGRFLGLHFFNPVPASRLVEIVVPAGTAQDSVT